MQDADGDSDSDVRFRDEEDYPSDGDVHMSDASSSSDWSSPEEDADASPEDAVDLSVPPLDYQLPTESVLIGTLLNSPFPTSIFPPSILIGTFFFALGAAQTAELAKHVLPPLDEVKKAQQDILAGWKDNNPSAARTIVLSQFPGQFYSLKTVDWWLRCHSWAKERKTYQDARQWIRDLDIEGNTEELRLLARASVTKLEALPLNASVWRGINAVGLKARDLVGLLSKAWLNDKHICTGLFIESALHNDGQIDAAASPPIHFSGGSTKRPIIHPSDPLTTILPTSSVPYHFMPPHVTTALLEHFDPLCRRKTAHLKAQAAERRAKARTASRGQTTHTEAPSEEGDSEGALDEDEDAVDGLEDFEMGDADTSGDEEEPPVPTVEATGVHPSDTDAPVEDDAMSISDQGDSNEDPEDYDFPTKEDGTPARSIMIAYAQYLRQHPEAQFESVINISNTHWATFAVRGNGTVGWGDSNEKEGDIPTWWDDGKGGGAHQAVVKFLKASAIPYVPAKNERMFSHQQSDGKSCGLFSIHNAVSHARGIRRPDVMNPTLYRLKLFMYAVLGPDAYSPQQATILQAELQKPERTKDKVLPVSVDTGQSIPPSQPSVGDASKTAEGPVSTLKSTLHSFFKIPSAPKPPPVKRPVRTTKPVKVLTLEEIEAEPQRKADIEAKRVRLAAEKEAALNEVREPTEAEVEGKAEYEEMLRVCDIMALNDREFICLCKKPIEHVKKVYLANDRIMYKRYDLSRVKGHLEYCALVKNNKRRRTNKVENPKGILTHIRQHQQNRPAADDTLPIELVSAFKYSCDGLTDANIEFYTTENELSTERGRLSAAMMNRLKVSLFRHKAWKKTKTPTTRLTKGQVRHLVHGIAVPQFQGEKNSKTSGWTQDEEEYYRDVSARVRRWVVEPKRVRSTLCRKLVDTVASHCEECTKLSKNASFRRQMHKAGERRLEHEALVAESPDSPPGLTMKSNRVPRALLREAFSLTIRHMDNPYVQRLLGSVSKGIGATFHTLCALAKEGKLSKWDNFLEICSALRDVALRSDAASPNKMRGMRWTERMMNIAILLRGYGHRSMQNYATFQALFPLPSERHVKKVMAKRDVERMACPDLHIDTFWALKRQLDRLGWHGPMTLATDCTKVSGSHGFTVMYAPYDDDGKRVGGHYTGSTLSWKECYVESHTEIPALTERIKKEDLGSKMMRCIYLRPPVSGSAPFLVCAMVVPSSETAEIVAGYLTTVRKMCHEVGIPILSLGSDSASIEIKAKVISADDPALERYRDDPRHTYWNPRLGVKMSAPVFNNGEPLINVSDPSHAANSTRNAFLGGAKHLTMGNSSVSFSVIDSLFDTEKKSLKVSDLHNLDRQDDGAALRMFGGRNLESMVDKDGETVKPEYKALFNMTFVFGELFDAWLNKELENTQRAKAAFRAYFFILTWKRYVDEAADAFTRLFDIDLMQPGRHFLADQTAGTLLSLCEAMICLLRAHRDFYPWVPFCPDKHGSEMCEHSYGQARQFDANFSMVSFLNMQRHLTQYFELMTSGQFDIKVEGTKMGYLPKLSELDAKMGPEQMERALYFPGDPELHDLCEVAWQENIAIYKLVGLDVSEPLKESEVAPYIERVTKAPRDDEADDETGENERRQRVLNQITRDKSQATAQKEAIRQETRMAQLADAADMMDRMAENDTAINEDMVKTYSLADCLSRLTTRNPEMYATFSSPFLLGGNVDIPLLVESRLKTSRRSKVHSEKELKPQLNPSDESEPMLYNDKVQYIASLKDHDPYFYTLSAIVKGRIQRWKENRGTRNHIETPTVSQAEKEYRYHQILVKYAGITQIPILPTVRVGAQFVQAKVKTGAFGIFALPRADIRGMPQPPLLAVGYIVALYEYKNKKHACMLDSENPHKLSYISTRLWFPDHRQRNPLNSFTESVTYKGSPYYAFSHLDPTSLVHIFVGADLRCVPGSDVWRLSSDAWSTFDAINRVSARLGKVVWV